MTTLPKAISRVDHYLEFLCGIGGQTDFNVNRFSTTANTELIFKFDDIGNEFLIKNLTSDDILVGVGDTFNKDCNILIPSETAQLLRVKTDTFSIMPNATDSKGVEILCIS